MGHHKPASDAEYTFLCAQNFQNSALCSGSGALSDTPFVPLCIAVDHLKCFIYLFIFVCVCAKSDIHINMFVTEQANKILKC